MSAAAPGQRCKNSSQAESRSRLRHDWLVSGIGVSESRKRSECEKQGQGHQQNHAERKGNAETQKLQITAAQSFRDLPTLVCRKPKESRHSEAEQSDEQPNDDH